LIDLGRQLAAETRRRVAAERAAHHWQTLARLRQDAVNRPAPEPTPEAVAPLPPAHSPAEPPAAAVVEVETGHPLIDGLLASPALDATQRIRVEAIASWYRRSGDLLDVECQDLEHFGRMAGLIPSFGDQRVAA
jgi:hypothetical protein